MGRGGASSVGGSSGTGGSVSTGGNTGAGGASSTGGANGTGGSTSACVPATTPANLKKVHNAGKDCIACHTTNGVSTTLAGTAYDSTGAALSGSTVTITQAGGSVLKLTTASNGNFWTNASISFPVQVEVSRCPDGTGSMSDSVTSSKASCNSCHRTGGSMAPIHVP